MRKYLPETILAAVLLLLAGTDLLTGGGGISIPSEAVFLKLRLPRLLTAVIAGGALSLCGIEMQSIFRNPLADPHIMGISSGAGLGAAIAVAAGGTAAWSLAGGALAGAFLTAAAIMAVSSRIKSATTVLLTGVMTGFILSAVTTVIQFRVSEQGLKVIYSWASGNFAGNDTTGILVMAGAAVIGLAIALAIRKGLDILLFGEEFATLSGAPVRRIRLSAILSCCIMCAAVTAFCGPIGFVGIVAPHVARTLTRSSVHSRIIPSGIMSGAVICIAADIIASLSASPLPSGSAVAFIGIPLILFAMLSQRMQYA